MLWKLQLDKEKYHDFICEYFRSTIQSSPKVYFPSLGGKEIPFTEYQSSNCTVRAFPELCPPKHHSMEVSRAKWGSIDKTRQHGRNQNITVTVCQLKVDGNQSKSGGPLTNQVALWPRPD